MLGAVSISNPPCMTGAYRNYRPITPADVTTREAQLALALGPAIRWQLWLFFEPGAFGGQSLAMPCDDLPRRPPPDASELLARMFTTVSQYTGCTELIVAIERRGGPDPNALDRAWMSALAEACRRADVRLRSVLISHTRGVREHEPPLPRNGADERGSTLS